MMALKETQSNQRKQPGSHHRMLAHLFGAFLSLPLRFKITIPYLVVAILLAGLATWVITQSFVNRLQERFNVQLVDGFETASKQVFQTESRALTTERAIARTVGVAEAVGLGNVDELNALVLPLATNAHAPLVQVLDSTGRLFYGLRLTSAGILRDEPIDFSGSTPIRRVLAGESDEFGDKFSGVVDGPGGPTLYVVGPLFLADRQVGAVLVGYPLETVLPQLVADSAIQVTLYRQGGQPVVSTFEKNLQLPTLGASIVAGFDTDHPYFLQNRLWGINGNEYNEAVGSLLVRGQPSGWTLGVALPRALITSSTRVSPAQLAVAFMLAILAVITLGVVVARIIAVPVFELVNASTRVAKGDLDASVVVQAQDELGLLSRQFNYMVVQLRQREFMRDLFGRMVSEEVCEALLHDNQMQLGGELKIVTVLFTDIRQFTMFSENHSPQEVVGMLNSYFGIVNQAVREAGGMINKFGGDSTLAIFGAPVKLKPAETASRALRAALAIRVRIAEANAQRVKAGLEPLSIGIGINTGEVITGNVGAEDRFEYTVIGDTVNVAFRMQGLSSQFLESNIFITGKTYQALDAREQLLVTDHGEVMLKGRTELVQVYSLMGMASSDVSAKTRPGNSASSSEILHRDALETAYLYCRGFDPATIAAAKNLPLKTVVSWLEEAAAQFEQYKQALRLEFKMSDAELRHLSDASRAGLPGVYSFEWETQSL